MRKIFPMTNNFLNQLVYSACALTIKSQWAVSYYTSFILNLEKKLIQHNFDSKYLHVF